MIFEFLAYLLIFISSITFTTITVPLVNNTAKRLNIFDKQEKRKQHKNLIVRLGGIALFLGFILSLLIVDIFFEYSVIVQNKIIITIITGFFLLGLIDDLKRISPWTRLVIEIILASFAWSSNYGIYIFDFSFSAFSSFYFELPIYLSYLITVFWIVGTTNAINWMDGLDGLASGIILIASFGMIIVCYSYGNFSEIPFLIALCGVCLGFLKYNLYPSKILMGDSGSYLLGFCIALFSISGSTRNIDPFLNISSTSILVPLLILLIPLGDMTSVIFSRIIRNKSPVYPDRSHLHYRLIDKGLSHKKTVYSIFVLSVINILILSILIKFIQ